MSLALALTVAMTLAMAGAASAPLAAAAETVAAETAAAGAPVGPLATMQDGPPARDPGEVVGRVLRGDGSGLPHAWISYRTEDGAWALAQAGADGHYRLQVAPGRLHLEGSHVGYRSAALEVVVPPGATVRVDLNLTPHPIHLDGILVRTDRFAAAPVPPGELRATPPRPAPELDLMTMALDGGLAEVASAIASARPPNGEPPGEGSQLLLLRGASADLKLLLLDGAPVYTPFHLAGLLDAFDTDLLGRASHFVGAAPSRHDGGIDYILDLTVRRPRDDGQFHMRGHLDLLSAGATAEWGLPQGGILASGRALHGAGPRMMDGGGIPHGYADGLVRAAWTAGGVHLRVTGFTNQETIQLGRADAPEVPERAAWGNQLLSLRATRTVGAIDWSGGIAASHYMAELPLRGDDAQRALTHPILAQGSTGRVRASLDGVTSGGGEDRVLRFGLTTDHTRTTYGSSLRTDEGSRGTHLRSAGRTLGGYVEYSTPLAPTVQSRLGVRVDHHDPGGLRGSLRGSMAWAVTPTAVLTLAGGRYHQFIRPPGEPLPTAEETTHTPLQVAQGDHLAVGLAQTLTPEFQLGLQGYVKQFHNLGGPDPARRASGVELSVQGDNGRHTGWLGYSLSWSWAETMAADGATDRFIGRHLLTAGFRGPLVGALGINARVSFSDGLPLTEVPLEMAAGSPAFNSPLQFGGSEAVRPPLARETPPSVDGFLRLDVELHGEWDAPLGEGRIRPYLKVMNALDRRDAHFYYFEPWRSPDPTPLAHRSILPVLGLAWAF